MRATLTVMFWALLAAAQVAALAAPSVELKMPAGVYRPEPFVVWSKAINPQEDGITYTQVRFNIIVAFESPFPEGTSRDAVFTVTHVNGSTDTQGINETFQLVDGVFKGYWGPQDGFRMDSGYEATTTFTVQMAAGAPLGTYTLTVELVNLVNNQVLASAQRTMVLSADTLTVGPGNPWDYQFNSVRAATYAAQEGHTVYITEGEYNEGSEWWAIEKPLTVVGAGPELVTINRSGAGTYGLYIKANGVTLKGFTFIGPSTNATWAYGFKIEDCSNLVIEDVVVKGCRRTGIDLNGVSNAQLKNVEAENNTGAGIALRKGSNILVQGAIAQNNGWGGLALFAITGETLEDVTIEDSVFSQNPAGIYAQGGGTFSEIVIQNNQITQNGAGVAILSGVNPSGITVQGNRIAGNTNFGVYNESTDVLTATCNWWGHETGPKHESNPGGSGDKISGNVTFNPWWVSEAGPCKEHVYLTMAQPVGEGTVEPDVGTYPRPKNEATSIKATPGVGHVFDEWQVWDNNEWRTATTDDGIANPKAASTTITMDGDKIVRAKFASWQELADVDVLAIDSIATVTGTPVIVGVTVVYGNNSGVPDDVMADAKVTANSSFPAGAKITKVVYNDVPVFTDTYDLGGKDHFYLSEVLGHTGVPLNRHEQGRTDNWEIWVTGAKTAGTWLVTVASVAYTWEGNQRIGETELDSATFSVTLRDVSVELTGDPQDRTVQFGGTLKFGVQAVYPTITNLDPRILTDAKIVSDEAFPEGAVINWTYSDSRNNSASGTHTLTAPTTEIYLSQIVGTDPTPLAGHNELGINWTFEITGLGSGTYNLTIIPLARLGSEEHPFASSGANITLQIQLTVQALTASKNFASGWQLLSVPAVGADASPAAVFQSVWPVPVAFWDPARNQYVTPEEIDPGRGYWVYLYENRTIQVTGNAFVGEYSVSLGKAGWHMVSTPTHDVRWGDVKVKVGSNAPVPLESVLGEVIVPYIFWYTGNVLDPYTAVLMTGAALDLPMQPWVGYWIKTLQDDVTLIIPVGAKPYVPGAPRSELSYLSSASLPAHLRPPAPPTLALVKDMLTVLAYPNPATASTVTFRALGLPVEGIRVSVFDLGGRRVWAGEATGHELAWNLADSTGRPLANGVYLYVVEARLGGPWGSTGLQRLLILR